MIQDSGVEVRELRFKVFSLHHLRILFLPVILMFCRAGLAQEQTQIKQIEIERYNSLEFDAQIAPDAQRIIGDVKFVHDDIIMTCDSAYYYSQHNTLDAFGHVHITKMDGSVNVYGDLAKYQGNIKFAEIWNNVVLEDADAVLKTQHLYYDLSTNIAYYVVGAEIFNKGNDMVSRLGYYHRNINMFYFKKEVVLHTPDYTIVTDTLDYNVHTKVADFVGPTYIQNEKDTIYCERGWYNTNDTVALFRRNAWIRSGSTTVNADTLFYESKTGNGRAFGNINIVDTTNNVILKGHKGEYNNLTEKAWLTGHALMIMAGKQDSLFLHADTLRSVPDTSGFKIMKAYHKAKFYSLDMQGKCDSLAMSLRDSVIRLYTEPVLWSQDNQMTAEYIEIETENQNPKRMNLLNRGFIVQREDTVGFNQIKGKKIVALFRGSNELYQVNVYGDGETIYYIKDGPDITGVNKLKSTDVVIRLKEKKAEEVNHISLAEGEMIPPNEFNPEELTLGGFQWLVKYRPIDKNDIFRWGEIVKVAKTDTAATSLVASSVETIDSLRRKIERLIVGKQAKIGVAVMGLKSKDTLTVNNRMYPMLSVYKYHIALAVLRLVDFGRIKTDQKVFVSKEELHADMYSPLRDNYPEGNVEITVAELMKYMISESDNNACDILLKLLKGPERVEQIIKSVGITDVTIRVTEREMHDDHKKQYDNRTTPLSAVKALEVCFRPDVISEHNREFLKKLMIETSTGPDKMKGKLPTGVVVGHKTGNSSRDENGIKAADNDIGFVRLPKEDYFLIAVLITDSKETDKTNADIIADITRMVWNYYEAKGK